MKRAGAVLSLAALLMGSAAQAAAARDPKNPTCPQNPDWSANRQMRLSVKDISGERVLLAEGAVDAGLVPRLAAVLKADPGITEIRLRSPGGNAAVGNEAGRLIRKAGIPTRIPQGWACFSACNFIFMGGPIRSIDPGGLFIVHMFTHVGDREGTRNEIEDNPDAAVDMIGDIEQSSALLASDDNDFLIRMGVSRKLLTEVMYRQKSVASGDDQSTRRCLTQAEVRAYNVVNAE
jgi:hypothetical protein